MTKMILKKHRNVKDLILKFHIMDYKDESVFNYNEHVYNYKSAKL